MSVYITAAGVTVRFDRLSLKATGAGPFCLENASATLEFAGGTLSAGDVSPQVTVSGGTFNTRLENAVARTDSGSYTNAYRVTVGGLAPSSLVEIEDIEGLDRYDTSGIYSDASGAVHLYLPDGEYYFRVRCDGAEKEMVVVVEGNDETAVEYSPTGVIVNGRDAARLVGAGWRNEDGLVRLYSATNYVVSGTNDGDAVTLSVEMSGATLTLANLVMTNGLMLASPIAFAGASAARYELELVGTNVICGSSQSAAAIELGETSSVVVSGEGRLEATGLEEQAGIGLSKGVGGNSASLAVTSGEIVTTGGAGAAGIGGARGQEGFNVLVHGGTVTATGGEHGAGIGGGYSAGSGGSMVVTNGVVTAIGGDKAAGIGGGWRGKAGVYRQFGGTVVARGADLGADIGQGREGYFDSSCYVRIYGGSLNSASDRITQQAQNMTGSPVYCVTIQTSRPNFDVGAVMADYHGYLLTGVKTDDEGKIYIWLPNGTYYINLGGVPYRAVVDNADAEAEPWSVGVFVNGEDVALRSGEGWTYDVERHALSVTGDGCVVSGTNTAGEVFIDCSNDVAVTVSNLVLTTSLTNGAPIQIASNVAVRVALMGENALASSWSGTPAISVPFSATLTITNIDSYVAVPDLDNVKHYTNTVESIEEEDDGHGGVVVVTNYVDIVTVVTNYDNVLTVPVLTAKGAYEAAAIGGGYLQSCGTIEIAGGVINATGGTAGAGIGSGSFNESLSRSEMAEQGTVKISGGKVKATGGLYAAGIGGGNRHTGGAIAVSGGEVEAYGDENGAGIGGGYRAHGHEVAISGGKVAAHGGKSAAGIGNGFSNALTDGSPARVSISGGQVTATGGESAPGIGAGYWDPQCAEVDITGGTVAATGGGSTSGRDGPDDIGLSGFTGYSSPTKQFCPLTIKGASVHATRRTASNESVEPAPSNGTARVWCVTVETPKTNEMVSVEYLSGFGEGSEIYADADGRIYLWLPNGTHIFYVGGLPFTATVNNADTTATEWLVGVTVDGVDVSNVLKGGKKWYYDYGERMLYIIADCVVSGTNTAGCVNLLVGPLTEGEGPAGDAEVTLTISNLCLKATAYPGLSPLAVTNGTVTVCLAGTNVLDASGTSACAGLSVTTGATLVVTNVEEAAALTAKGGAYAAGIGGDRSAEVGTIAVSGGIIEASGGREGGAGIGGGYAARYGDGAKIAISGGTISARGGWYESDYHAADIGLGMDPDSGAENYKIVFSGSSTWMGNGSFDETGHVSSVLPVNEAGARVYKVTVPGFTPYAKVELEMPGYGTNGIYADGAGSIYLWLANGTYYVNANGRRYALRTVNGATTTIALPEAYGVKVDGVDVVNLSGDAWSYDPFTDKLALTGDCTLSGTNTYRALTVSVNRDVTVAVERLSLSSSDPTIDLFAGGGTLTITNGTSYLSGLVPRDCDLVIRGGSHMIEAAMIPYVSNGSEEVNPVILRNFEPNAPVVIEGPRDYDYGTSNIYADGSGRVYLWLPEGVFNIAINGVRYILEVDFLGNGTLEEVVGIAVDGADVKEGSGAGWEYDAGNGCLNITAAGDYTLSGTNTEGKVSVCVKAADGAVNLTLDGLCLTGYTEDNAYGPIFISDTLGTTEVNITLVSTNTLVTSASSGTTRHAAIFVPQGRTLTIGGDGVLWAESKTGAAIGGRDGGTCGNIVISGGTVDATSRSGSAIGSGGGSYSEAVTIAGGSVKATDGGLPTVATNAANETLSCVEVPGLTPGAAVAFDGLPPYYGTSGIVADAAGKVYLWLPENWDTGAVTPHLFAATLHASSGTSHAFAANGYRYTVTIPAGGGEAVATQGDALELEGFRINDFAVADGVLTINVSAKPDTWLYGFFDRVAIHSSESLPIQMTPATRLDTSAASVTLEDDGSATYTLVLPPAEGSSRFFTIGSR